MFTQEGDNITVTTNEADWNLLLLMVGMAVGAAVSLNDRQMAYSFLRLANRLNEGNPRFMAYVLPEES